MNNCLPQHNLYKYVNGYLPDSTEPEWPSKVSCLDQLETQQQKILYEPWSRTMYPVTLCRQDNACW